MSDYAAQVERLVQQVQQEPSNQGALDQLAQLAQAWATQDGGEPTDEERTARVELARWLGHASPSGLTLHFGWREAAVAAALGFSGGRVVSYLDHPGRAIAAAIAHGSSELEFQVHSNNTDLAPQHTSLVVVETVGIHPVIDLSCAMQLVAVGGTVAVLGMPALLTDPGLLELGTFCLHNNQVVPCAPGSVPVQLTLARRQGSRAADTDFRRLPLLEPKTQPPSLDEIQPEFNQAVQQALRQIR